MANYDVWDDINPSVKPHEFPPYRKILAGDLPIGQATIVRQSYRANS